MARVDNVVDYEEGIAICSDEYGEFLIQERSPEIIPLSEALCKKCYLTDTRREVVVQN